MTDMRKSAVNRVRGKARYHHGELREALIRATRQLVEQRGAENFTRADACRVAGVTTVAPYRHFRGKQEILEEIAALGFKELSNRSMAMLAEKGGAPWTASSPWGRPMSPSRPTKPPCSA